MIESPYEKVLEERNQAVEIVVGIMTRLCLESDQKDKALLERDMAIAMLADWCCRVKFVGTGWDDWDESYKDAAYRPGPLRELLDKAIEEEKKFYLEEK